MCAQHSMADPSCLSREAKGWKSFAFPLVWLTQVKLSVSNKGGTYDSITLQEISLQCFPHISFEESKSIISSALSFSQKLCDWLKVTNLRRFGGVTVKTVLSSVEKCLSPKYWEEKDL